MNIFHQLRTGGDPDFQDIYAEVRSGPARSPHVDEELAVPVMDTSRGEDSDSVGGSASSCLL